MILFGKHLATEMEHGASTWIKKESSKHPGKHYFFNTASGESRWEPPEEETGRTSSTNSRRRPNESRAEKLLKVKASSGVCKSSKTPAQDRLSRLQTKLAVAQVKKEKLGPGNESTRPKLHKEEKRTVASDIETPKNAYQKTDLETREDGSGANASTSSVKNRAQKELLRESNNGVPNCSKSECKRAVKRSREGSDLSLLAKIPRLTVEALGKIPKLIHDKLSNKSTKEKTDLRLAQNTQKDQVSQATVEADKNTFLVNNSKAANESFHVINSQNNITGDTNDKNIENTKSVNVPAIPQRPFLTARRLGSANARLTNLRKALEEQRKTIEQNNDPTLSANASSSSPTLTESREYSPMEWEEIQEQINEKITEIRQDNDKEDEGVLGDFYNIVNQNLLKLCAEQNNDSFVKGNCFYFVVDTNVFLRNLSFVDDLRKLKFCGTDCSVIVVPYSVLQELDRIKQRSKTAVCTLAVRAIKYLNKRFEANDERVRGQNAIEANRHLISIENADDNILNCCLQIKEKTDKILLLTNDVNLRNKASCNRIPVSAKGDLDSTDNLSST